MHAKFDRARGFGSADLRTITSRLSYIRSRASYLSSVLNMVAILEGLVLFSRIFERAPFLVNC